MKKCPNCQQQFSDDNSFCLNDGTTLQSISEASRMPTVFLTPESSPTQFIPRLQVNQANQSNGIPGWLYAVLGAMAAIIVALLMAFFISRSPAEKETAKTEQSNQSNENKLQVNAKENTNVMKMFQTKNPTRRLPTLTNRGCALIC